ncbi:thiolase family protein [Desulfosporosinus sp. BICA1-9]|uniref:thiolase family protein n=1 Tax=Desulfosporosinus sp. BICA1-9 TaxID=1531958 RepID=UPI00054BC7AB|nr:thiolase family protein [Desulfosporosinus sp. BICA1-9]KJS49894.1 MAG: acetyl-CoA acetyltransferase [Peptococcaceae bacterium BRH_c23]KJS84226.1 MAG: acetyl-CoA acetyltransferase [Desulfosporosinus sp. BICA1-9]HBW37700.1 acetyl-CoA C-acyltransferase [Desulfosporosinus sp.]
MDDVVIVAAVRTPIGSFGGAFKEMRAPSLTVPVMQELIRRTGIDPGIIDDVIWGCCYQRTKDETNLARVAALQAGIPVEVPAVTIHRTCTSAMTGLAFGAQAIRCGDADVILVGGTESMSTVPFTVDEVRWGAQMKHIEMRDAMWDGLTQLGTGAGMGITAENVAQRYNISREAQDELALLSQRRAVSAIKDGRFKDEIVAVTVPKRKSAGVVVDTDEHPRADVTLEKLAKASPAFQKEGTVTAGNSSGINDGSAGVLIMSRSKAQSLGIKPLAKLISYAVAGVDPDYMGIGPVPATHKALQKAGLSLKDIDLWEVNEAFAAQYLAVEKELGLDRNITNVNGSGIALGHPVGASGIRIVVTLLHEMAKRKLRTGLATLCSGGGMGMAVIVEIDLD